MRKITPAKPGWADWPTHDQLLKLSKNADGLFHYAGTALQWIKKQVKERGLACQKEVFEQVSQLGIGNLEELYKLILTSLGDIDGLAESVLRHQEGFRQVIGTILVLQEGLALCEIIALLGDIPPDTFDVTNFLEQFLSVLTPGMITSFEEATPQMHKSFRDYIISDHAPAEFHIFPGHAHFLAAKSCLEVVVNAGSQPNIALEYSVRHWYKHLEEAVKAGETCDDERMWNLLGGMVQEAVVNVWAKDDLERLFVGLATAGWALLKQVTDKERMESVSSILTETKVRGGRP
ncbi:hypothetical protein C8F04DRAFT_959888 [Mycena alexandri]|uniref:Uncharacterized protein n=1 Tax=Mycena alexandri TaxID=1745969 RepID=A0AAD6SQU6_9AGAR|nr:hypothetical protein C8F04DRAFT_959888 [Mycena alexandri]